jgi:glycosyltransferase involved in cell wall biosynthesis
MAKPKVSVVVPIYGVEKYLCQCVDSILAQTLRDIEVILVDDGSPDKCPGIVDDYAVRDSRIVPIHQPNCGYGRAVNHGIEVATGEYIAILESDDWIEPTMYEKLYANAIANESDFVKCSFYVYNSTTTASKRQNREWKTNMDLFAAPTGAFTLKEFPQIILFHASVWAGMYRAGFVKDIKMIETGKTMYQDFPFMCMVISSAKRMSVQKDYLVHYRMEQQQNNSISQKDEKLLQIALRHMDAIEILKKNGVLGMVREEIYYHCFAANFGFFNRIMTEFKRTYFDELHCLFAPLANDATFTFKFFSKKEKQICKAIIANDFDKTMHIIRWDRCNVIRALITLRTFWHIVWEGQRRSRMGGLEYIHFGIPV